MPVSLLVFAVLSFLLGCVPFAYILVRFKTGIDIRQVGSGNVGATNASRVLGKPLGMLVLALDVLKGVIPAGLFPLVLAWAVNRGWWVDSAPWLGGGIGERGIGLCLGLAAFLGHCFNPFLGFKGGKGVATALGVYLVVAWQAALLTAVVCVLIILVTRIVSIASITGAVILPIGIFVFDLMNNQGELTRRNLFVVFLTALISAMVIFRHRSNIKRLLQGSENKAL